MDNPEPVETPTSSASERQGRALERLVAVIERVTAADESISVESPKFIRDRDGELREFDVVLTWRSAHHTLVTAIECRDRSRPVGVPDLEGFSTKCLRTRVHRGVIVSSSGFAESAVTAAAGLNLECFTLEAAEQFDWCLARGVLNRHRELVGVWLGWEHSIEIPRPVTVISETGDTVDRQGFVNIGLNCLRTLGVLPRERESLEDENEQKFVDLEPKVTLRGTDGVQYTPDRLLITVRYRIRETLIPFSFHTYATGAGNRDPYTTAIARFDERGIAGNLVLLNDADGVKISWVPDAAVARRP